MTASRRVQFIAATTGIVDEDGDLFRPGCFAASRTPRITASPADWSAPIGRVEGLVELRPGDPALPARTADGEPWPRGAGALVGEAIYNLDVKGGANAYDAARRGRGPAALVLGFQAKRARRTGGVRVIDEAEVYTLAPPGAPMDRKDSDVRGYEIKAAPGGRPWERDREDDRDDPSRRTRPLEPGKIDPDELDELDEVDDDVSLQMSPDGLAVLSCLTCSRQFGWSDTPARVSICEHCARRSARSSVRRAARGGTAGRDEEAEASPALRAAFPRQPRGSREPGADAAPDARYRQRPDGTLDREDDDRGRRPGGRGRKPQPPPFARRP